MWCHCLLQCRKMKSESEITQSCPTLSDPMDCSLPDSSIHGIFQARVLEWGAIAFSNETMWESLKEERLSRIFEVLKACSWEHLLSSKMRKRFGNWKKDVFYFILCYAAAAAAKSLQSCPTLCDPIDGRPPGSSVPGILQARTLEWVAISFSSA